MSFWAWFWIWFGLLLLSLAFFAAVGLDLLARSKPLLAQLKRTLSMLETFNEAMSQEAPAVKPTPATEKPIEDVFAERAEVIRHRAKRRDARERRLVKALANIDVNERRFTNG